MNETDQCCCGHMPARHHPDYGYCMECPPGSCLKIHAVGDGHHRPALWPVILAALVIAVSRLVYECGKKHPVTLTPAGVSVRL